MNKNLINLSINELLNTDTHIGENKIKRHQEQSARILAYKNKKDIINLKTTLQDLTPILHIITETISNKEEILIIAQNSSLNHEEFPQPIITQKWIYGALSNFKITKNSKKSILKRIPNAIILLHTNTADLLLNETKYLEIPTITFQQTKDNPIKSQYTLLANINNPKTINLFLKLFSKAAFYGYAKQLLKFKKQ